MSSIATTAVNIPKSSIRSLTFNFISKGFKDAEYNGFSFKAAAAVDSWRRASETYKANHPEAEVVLAHQVIHTLLLL